MNDKSIFFQSLDWEKPKKGVEQKVYSDGNKRLRLLKFKNDFIEKNGA